MTKNDIETCHRLDDNRKMILKFVNRKPLFEVLKNKIMVVVVDLNSTELDKNTSFLSQNLSDYNNKIAFHWYKLVTVFFKVFAKSYC